MFGQLKISLDNTDVTFFAISAALGQICFERDVSDFFSAGINKGYIEVTLPPTDCNFHMVTGVFFLGQNALISFMRDIFDRL